MKHRYFSYFFWTIISWAISFLFFVLRFEVNIFSLRHWSLLFSHIDRLPASFVFSFMGFVVLWVGGGLSMRYFFKLVDRREELSPYHSPEFAHAHLSRPVSVSDSAYIPQKGYYDGEKIKKPVISPVENKIEIPKKPRLSDVLLETSTKPPVVTKQEDVKLPEKKQENAADLKKLFDRENIKWLPTPKIGDLKLSYFGVSNDHVFLFSVVNEPTAKMMFAETADEAYWMNEQKERMDSPLALIDGVRKSFMGMCKKAFKNHIPFEVKVGVLFTAPPHDKLPALKEKYSNIDLFSLDGDKLPLIDTVLSGDFDTPSDEFIEFASSVAHYFDKTYQIIKADESESDEED